MRQFLMLEFDGYVLDQCKHTLISYMRMCIVYYGIDEKDLKRRIQWRIYNTAYTTCVILRANYQIPDFFVGILGSQYQCMELWNTNIPRS